MPGWTEDVDSYVGPLQSLMAVGHLNKLCFNFEIVISLQSQLSIVAGLERTNKISLSFHWSWIASQIFVRIYTHDDCFQKKLRIWLLFIVFESSSWLWVTDCRRFHFVLCGSLPPFPFCCTQMEYHSCSLPRAPVDFRLYRLSILQSNEIS